MRIRNIGVLCFAGGLVVLWMGCSGDRTSDPICAKAPASVPKPGRARDGEACVLDADCRSGFCNRAICVDPALGLGHPCDPPAPDARPLDKLPERLCSGFLCMEGRCRSCRSDAECQSYFGVGKCTVRRGTRGRYAVCEPNTTRRRPGSACEKDTQCESLFCDRGQCASIGDLARQNYGEACIQGPPRAPPEDLLVAPPGGRCEGYLCVDGRCRSCQSDAECQAAGSSDLKCLEFDIWNGKVCVTPSAAALHPPPVMVPSRAPHVDWPARAVPQAPPAPRSR